MEKFRLTTVDNPYDPFTQWNEWYFYDISKGYCTCERLARTANIPMQVPDAIFESEIEAAADQMIFEGAFSKEGLYVDYKKVLNPKISN